ncbi:MAG: bifunctional glutamate N-acetyltransferase/amino-acid acetyltransferase ArgJ [Acidobacteria bacterium]|nr:bifunctional glutamate N-acetyltransferase/amino-acid acetyltransferase ArgJ [Acidobacteriota bacterium]
MSIRREQCGLDTVEVVSATTSIPVLGRLPLGFRWSAVTAGIKTSGKPDLALAACEGGASAAAMYTSNQVVAAPVTVGRRHLAATSGRVTSVLVNAGNANCATGQTGIEDCHRSCVAVADAFGCVFDEIFPSSTGIIGVPLPLDKLVAAVPNAVLALGDQIEDAEGFARAIMTTDTRLKTAQESFVVDGRAVNLFGCAKGAGMIGPQLVPHATMLAYVFTDLQASPAELQQLLEPAVDASFNNISIDGDMSTNDTVLLLASGRSGVPLALAAEKFAQALHRICGSLAHAIVDDGEGVTHVVTLSIVGAETHDDAKAIARTIASSPLCKTAWSSADPNWGRLLAAAGRAGVAFNPADVLITIAGLPVFSCGQRAPEFDEAATHAAMSEREYIIRMQIGSGPGHTEFITCDLTHEYVAINADYST